MNMLVPVTDNTGMSIEKGSIGYVGLGCQRVAVETWELDHGTGGGKAYFDAEQFVQAFDVRRGELPSLIGTQWLMRFDTDERLYYGSGGIVGLSLPSLQRPSPAAEYFTRSLAIYFNFLHDNYGPYQIGAAMAMARNGNDMFLDLLTLAEIETRAGSGDVRFASFL